MNTHRRFQGTVVSSSMEKTIVVAVETVKMHPLYRKRMRRHRTYHVHAAEPKNFAVGSQVEFEECRPISKTKRWRVI